MRTYLGIDPGLSGALAALVDTDGALRVYAWDTPTIAITRTSGRSETEYLDLEMVKLIERLRATHRADLIGAALETVLFLPGQSTAATGKTGVGYGIWRGILAAQAIPAHLIAPSVWKTAVFKGTGLQAASVPRFLDEEERKRLFGQRKRRLKENSRLLAQRLFPHDGSLFSLVKHDGRAEAALLAYWLRRHLTGLE